MALNQTGEWTGGAYSSSSYATVLTNGNLVSFSVQTGAGGVKQLVGQLFTPMGAAVGASFLLKTATGDDIISVTATTLADGRFAVAWVNSTGEHESNGLEVGIFNSNGSVFKAPVQVGSSKASWPQLATLADGGYVVNYNDSGTKTVAFSASGEPGPVSQFTSFSRPESASLRGGSYVTITQVAGASGSGNEIKARIQAQDGKLTEIVVKALSGSTTDFQVTGLANGNFVVAWRAWDANGNDFIKAQIVNSNGVLVGGELTLHQATEQVGSIALEALFDGGFALAFEQWEWL